MRERLITYLETLFDGAADTARNREMKQEVIQNTLDRFDDAIRDGLSQEAAYQVAVDGMGAVEELLEHPKKEETKQSGSNLSFADRVYRVLVLLLWIVFLFFYLALSVLTGAWYITWLMLGMAFSLQKVLKAIFDGIGRLRK